MLSAVRHSTFARIGLVLLLLIAAVPQVVCSCGMTWGPAGLFGTANLCPAAKAGKKECCCCKQNADRRCADAPDVGATDCDCRFFFAPLAGNGAAPQTPAMTDSLVVMLAAADIVPPTGFRAAILGTHNADGDGLTAGRRCALLQTWRA